MKKLSLVAFGWLISIISFAQVVSVSPATEGVLSANNSRAGGISGVYNIDLFTGVANINIPIYDFNVDGLDLGISFSYNTQGIKVDQLASEVGLGWNLNYGASLVREVSGLEDEVDLGFYYGNWTHNTNGSFDSYRDIFLATLGKSRVIKFWRPQNTRPFLEHAVARTVESKAFLKTLLTKYTTNPTIPDAPATGYMLGMGKQENAYFIGMIIEDEYGNKFHFKRGDYQRKQIFDSVYYATSKWVVEKVVTKTGKEVKYEYDYYNVDYPSYKTEKTVESDKNDVANGYHFVLEENKIMNTKGKIALLKKVTYPNGIEAKLIYEEHIASTTGHIPPKLKKIEIRCSSFPNSPNKITYALNHSYFHSNGPELTTISGSSYGGELTKMLYNCRLKLNSITRVGSNNHTEPYYDFSYESFYNLPERLSPKKDLYGYYNNGSVTPLNLNGSTTYLEIPYHQPETPGVNAFGTDRNSHFPYNTACILTWFKNNKGGIVDLEYTSQQNMTNVSNVANADLLYANADDGVIVNDIIEDDGYGNKTWTDYTYQNGQRFFKGAFFNDKKHYYNFPIVGYDTYNGCIHGYSDVTVVSRNLLTNEVLSRTSYRFDNFIRDPHIADPPVDYGSGTYSSWAGQSHIDGSGRFTRNNSGPYYRRSIDNHYMGTLLEQTTYDPNNILKEKTKYVYELLDHPFFTNTKNTYVRLKKKTVSRYEGIPASEFKTEFNYAYNTPTSPGAPIDLLMHITSTNSKGESTQRSNVWNKNEQVGEAYYLKKTGATTFEKVSYWQTGFTNSIPHAQLALIKKNLSDAGSIQEVEYTKVEPTLVNVKEALNKITGRYSATIWDTRINQKLAEADNARYDEVAYTSFEGNFAPGLTDNNKGNWEFDNSAVGQMSGVLGIAVTGLSYCALHNGTNKVTSQHPLTNGKRYILSFWAFNNPPKVLIGNAQVTMQEQFNIGNNWKLYTAEITGPGKITLEQTSPAVSCAFDELRLHPIDAAMTSYTYEPLFGVSSITDARNNIIYQEYDRQGRPSIIRDIHKNILSKTDQVIQGSDN